MFKYTSDKINLLDASNKPVGFLVDRSVPEDLLYAIAPVSCNSAWYRAEANGSVVIEDKTYKVQ